MDWWNRVQCICFKFLLHGSPGCSSAFKDMPWCFVLTHCTPQNLHQDSFQPKNMAKTLQVHFKLCFTPGKRQRVIFGSWLASYSSILLSLELPSLAQDISRVFAKARMRKCPGLPLWTVALPGMTFHLLLTLAHHSLLTLALSINFYFNSILMLPGAFLLTRQSLISGLTLGCGGPGLEKAGELVWKPWGAMTASLWKGFSGWNVRKDKQHSGPLPERELDKVPQRRRGRSVGATPEPRYRERHLR